MRILDKLRTENKEMTAQVVIGFSPLFYGVKYISDRKREVQGVIKISSLFSLYEESQES